MPRTLAPASLRAAAAALLLAACTDNPLANRPADPPADLVGTLLCSVDVRAETLECRRQDPPSSGARFDKLFGGQDIYVRLTSSGTAYDGGTEILSSNVTVQNLTMHLLGTTDGSTVEGLKVFFMGDPVANVGSATVIADSTDTFTGANQPYYLYNQILSTNQISSARQWQFQLAGGATSFTFLVAIAAPMVDEGAPMLDKIWEGDVDAGWETAGNWSGDAAPDSSSAVGIPSDSLFAGNMPVLAADASLTHLRVGFGSTLDLNANRLTAWGNVDAVGTISGGSVRMGGTGALLRGNLPAVEVTGSTRLQGATRATGAVSVTGSLTLNGNALNIAVP